MTQLPYSSLVLGMMIASLLTACDGGGGSSSTTTSTSASDITVERGPLLFTNLVDNYGFPATSQGEGHYAFTNNTPTYPLKTTGGYIDVNRNGIIDAGDVKAGELSLSSFGTGVAITIASSLANNSDIKNKLLALGFTEDQLANQTPSQDRMIAGLSDEVYAYIVENAITDLSQISGEQFETISSKIQSRIANYKASSATVSQL